MINFDEIFVIARFSGLLKVKNGNSEGYIVIKGGKLVSAYAKIGHQSIKAEPALKLITSILRDSVNELNLTQLREEEINRFQSGRLSEERLFDLEIDEMADWRKDFITKINGAKA